MRLARQDWIALALFLAVAAGGLWLWNGERPVVWLRNFAITCGF